MSLASKSLSAAVLVGAVAVAHAPDAHAQVPFYEPGNVVLTVGGGIEGFTDGTMNDTTDPGGAWAARAVFNARSTFALEAAYVGSAQAIDAFGLDSSAILVGHGAEGALRFGISPMDIIQPYIFLGAAWRRYSLSNTETNFSDVSDRDDVFEVPMGGGLTYHVTEAFVLDARAQYRPAFGNDLTAGQRELHRWGVTANLGVAF